MGYDWTQVKEELLEFDGSLNELSPLALDSLYGSVQGLRWKGLNGMDMTLEAALRTDWEKVMGYTSHRLDALSKSPNFTFTSRAPERCRVGCGTFGWKYDPSIVRYAAEQGALIDTAEGYGFGRVETRLGEALVGVRSPQITTKVRRDHMAPSSLRNAMMRSRQKLGVTPHYQLHYPHHLYPEAVLQLADFQREGLIRSIGIGNCSVDQIESDQRLLSDYSGGVLRSVQVPFSLVNQRVKSTVIPYCQERGILVLAYSPLGQSYKAVDHPILRQVAKKYDAPPATVALAWVLGYKGVMPIPRTNNLQHLKQNLEAFDLVLDEGDQKRLERAYS